MIYDFAFTAVMKPEQCRGVEGQSIFHKADEIYVWFVVVYELSAPDTVIGEF